MTKLKKTNFNDLDFFLPFFFFAEHSYHTKAEKKYLKNVYSNVEIGFVRLYFPKKETESGKNNFAKFSENY